MQITYINILTMNQNWNQKPVGTDYAAQVEIKDFWTNRGLCNIS